METNTKYLTLLAMSMCLILLNHQTSAEESKGKELIDKMCKQTPNNSLCVEVLSSDIGSDNADMNDLALLSLKAAATNAKDILVDVKKMIDDQDLDPGIQQGLSDCKETLLDAQSQLEDTAAALLVPSAKGDTQLWLKAALAAIDTCDDSIPGDDDILSRRSVGFRQLCDIAVAICKALPNRP